jgi:diaminopimelate decarboxylase
MVEVNGTLLEVVRRYGTPTYAYDIRRLRAQVEKLRAALPAAVEILYSLKANASLGICDVFASTGIGADVASAGEFATAVAAGFPPDQIFVAGPFKSPETIALVRANPEAILSVDSPSEFDTLCNQGVPNRCVLRLRPDFSSAAVVSAGSGSRFGFTGEDLVRCGASLDGRRGSVVGFHVFAGSQVLKADGVNGHLQGAFKRCQQAAECLGITPVILNLGGGFGIPYGRDDAELDLDPIGKELSTLVDRARPARVILELGRYLVAQAGWYLTTVLGHQTHQGRPAVVVDGGTHQRADLCGLCLRTRARPPEPLDVTLSESHVPTDVLGSLSLPADVLAEASSLPSLVRGNVLAFASAGAYGLWSSPALFHGSPLPAEVAFDGSDLYLMRQRRSARSILDDQEHIPMLARHGSAASGASSASSPNEIGSLENARAQMVCTGKPQNSALATPSI